MWDWIEKAAELQAGGTPFVLATIVRVAGSTPRESGAKMIVLPDGSSFGTVGGGRLEQLALNDARACMAAGEARLVRYPLVELEGHLCGGHAEVFFDVIGDRPDLYLFGAGHVGQALSVTMAGTPFHIHLIDDREEWVLSDKVPKQVIRHRCPWRDFVKRARWDREKTFVAIMTPSHRYDTAILKAVIKRPCRYLGMIGSRRKWAQVQTSLRKAGIPKKAVSRVACPIGLPIGGKTPKEIAVSVAAQLIQTLNG